MKKHTTYNLFPHREDGWVVIDPKDLVISEPLLETQAADLAGNLNNQQRENDIDKALAAAFLKISYE